MEEGGRVWGPGAGQGDGQVGLGRGRCGGGGKPTCWRFSMRSFRRIWMHLTV